MSRTKAIKTLPWGDEVYIEVGLTQNSSNKFYLRHGKNTEGKQYLEFTKFGPKPNNEGEMYIQKLRLYSPVQWAQMKYYVEQELAPSIGWDLIQAEQELEDSIAAAAAA